MFGAPEGLLDEKSVSQTILVRGKVLHSTATIGTIRPYDTKNKPTGDVMDIGGLSSDGTENLYKPCEFLLTLTRGRCSKMVSRH